MPFTDEERAAWHRDKRVREASKQPTWRPEPIATCVSCNNPFGINGGVVTDEAALCDICLGD